MLDPLNVPAVDPNEMLSRFVLSRRHINQQAKTVKADAFVPHPYDELSVTRQLAATDAEIWSVGEDVAAARQPCKTLYGRGDALAATYLGQSLDVVSDPVKGNPNHVVVLKWPVDDKAAQLLIAKEIAAVAKYIAKP